MIIATRTLTLDEGSSSSEIPIVMFAPEKDGAAWLCRYEVDWPAGRWSSSAAGVDSIQAIHLALQKIGAEIYASEHHESAKLKWFAQGRGYGFPVPKNARDQLEGDDKTFEG